MIEGGKQWQQMPDMRGLSIVQETAVKLQLLQIRPGVFSHG